MGKVKSPHDILTMRTGGGTLIFSKWIEENKLAREFCCEWVKMRAAGETDWSVARVLAHLQSEFACPFRSQNSLNQWIRRHFPDEFKKGVER